MLRVTSPIQGLDVSHQLWRLRHAKRMPDGEVELIVRTLAESIQSYDQVTEVRVSMSYVEQPCSSVPQLLSLLPPHHQGLLPLSFGLFHQQDVIRDLTVVIFNELRSYPVSPASPILRVYPKLWVKVGVQFLQALNHFQRYAYVRQAHALEARIAAEENTLTIPAPHMSNRSETSLTGG